MQRQSESLQQVEIQNHTFDDIMEKKIGCGKLQYICGFTLGMMCLADGAEMQVLGFILPVIKNEWNVSDWQINMMGSWVFILWGIAAFGSGYICDLYGRKIPMLVSTFGQAFFALISAASQNYWQLLIFRSLFAFFLGIGNPLSATYMSEIVPKEKRGKILALVYNMFPFGEVVAIVCAYICLSNLHTGSWRLLLVLTSIPGIVAFVMSLYYLKESPRYLLIAQNNLNSKEEALQLLDFFGEQNHNKNYQKLNQQEIDGLMKWAEEQKIAQGKYQASFKQLFSDQYASTTYKTMLLWFSFAFIYYGILFQLPTVLFKIHQENGHEVSQTKKTDFFGIFLAALVEIPSNVLGLFLLENQGMGRKFTLYWSYIICTISSFIVYIHAVDDSIFFFFIAVVKFFINICFLACYIFTSEIYPTSFRSTGVGFMNSVTRFGGILMPWVSMFFYIFGNTGPFLFCTLISAACAFAAYKIPTETKNMTLDTYAQIKDINSIQYQLQNSQA